MMRAVLAAALIAVSASAAAQDAPSIEDVASDAAYGFCPLFLAGHLPLNAPELARAGFGAAVQSAMHPQLGLISTVKATPPGGEVTFGGASGQICNVTVTGASRGAVLVALRERKGWMGIDFQSAPAPGADDGTSAEHFTATVEGQTLHLMLLQSESGTPAIAAQLYVTES